MPIVPDGKVDGLGQVLVISDSYTVSAFDAIDQRVEGLETKEDKIMKIIKSMRSLSIVLLVLMSTTTASAGDDLHWAVAHAFESIGKTGYIRASTYGAAWNFPSREEAEKAAMEACRKRTLDQWNKRRWPRGGCEIRRSDKNSCFYIIRRDHDDKYLGKFTGFGVSSESYPSRALAEAAAKRNADSFTNNPHDIVNDTVEMVKCSGVQ